LGKFPSVALFCVHIFIKHPACQNVIKIAVSQGMAAHGVTSQTQTPFNMNLPERIIFGQSGSF